MDITRVIEALKTLPEYPGVRKRMSHTGTVYFYELEPGDKTKYQIMMSPLSLEMCLAHNVPDGSMLATFILGNTMRSFPVDLEHVWDVGYLKTKAGFTDIYTAHAFRILLVYVADDILTERRMSL